MNQKKAIKELFADLSQKEPLTEAMQDAGATAGREYMERTGGISLVEIYRALQQGLLT
jgi:hypothetical protein